MNPTTAMTHPHGVPLRNADKSELRAAASTGGVLIRCALALAVVLGSVLGLWASAASEQAKLPNAGYALRVEKLSPTEPDRGEILRKLSSIALRQGEDVFVEVPTPGGRTVYAAGAAAEKWLVSGYRGIPGSPRTEVKPLSELPHADYRQVLELSGNSDFRDRITQFLADEDIQYAAMENQLWATLLVGTSLGDSLPLLFGFCAVLCVIASILNSRAEAIRTLHGFYLSESTGSELRRAAGKTIPILLALVLAANLVVALLTNRFSALQ